MTHRKILVADDEPQIRRALTTALRGHGYEVVAAEDGEDALARLATWLPDVLVLDLVMPKVDGFEVLREVRTWSPMPVIVLSARGREADKVTALDLGADDYLTKPFGIEELLARVRAVLRRSRTAGDDHDRYEVQHVTIDVRQHIVTRAGEEVHLTPTEFDLLAVLAVNAGKVMTHRALLERVWGGYAAENAQQLRVYVNYLRRKLELDPSEPALIVTEPGIGYRLRP